MHLMSRRGPMSYRQNSDSEDDDEVVVERRPKREKRKARHAVYRAVPAYPVMFMPPAPYSQYPVSAVAPSNPVQRNPKPVASNLDLPPQRPAREVVADGPGDQFVREMAQVAGGGMTLPPLQTCDIRNPPTQVPIYERGRA